MGESADEGAHLVRALERKGRVLHEALHGVQRVGQGGERLERQPFVDHERVALPARKKRSKAWLRAGRSKSERMESAATLSVILSARLELLLGASASMAGSPVLAR